jgi:hypothetical protein
MYATTRARLVDHATRSARPRPFCSSRSTRMWSSSAASLSAMSGVRSVLALSAIVIRHENGTSVSRKRWSRWIDLASASSSL